MKGKLHKMVSGYILSLNGDIDDPYAIVNKELANDHGWHRLSLENCQAIERGYDLDELAMGYDLYENINFVGQMRAFKAGFQKALKLMSDKKFSEEDVSKVVTHVLNELVLIDGFDKQYLFPESIYQETTTKCKSLQQTQWDVEIRMEEIHFGGGCYKKQPKLDATGCLILKRI